MVCLPVRLKQFGAIIYSPEKRMLAEVVFGFVLLVVVLFIYLFFKEQISKHYSFLTLGYPEMSQFPGNSIMPQRKATLASLSHFLMILNSILSLSSGGTFWQIHISL